jgi:ABC-type polysaccharide/polyol phosphate transport system ATPase subunit
MSNLPLVQVENLVKSFVIYDNPNDRAKQLFSRSKRGTEFTALRDITFQLLPGEALGVIGPNGAGKSTLLRLIAGMMSPTSGNIVVRGKIHALFELASGFNAHLSGRDNIYQKATMFGLTLPEVSQRFDEIVAFSELEEVIDNPLGTYSAGMQGRLAFAVATCIDADVFLIDEILSVGDEYFQGQCRRRIRDLVGQGKSAIIVTHDLAAYLRLCNRGLYLDKGRVVAEGDPLKTGELYISTQSHYMAPRPEGITITRLEIVRQERNLIVRIHYSASADIAGVDAVVAIEKIDPLIGWETCLLEPSFSSGLQIQGIRAGETGHIDMNCTPLMITGQGRYYVSALLRPATGSLTKPPMYYDAVGWTTRNFDCFFDISDGGEAIFSQPDHWTRHSA